MGAACEITHRKVGKDGVVRDKTSPHGTIEQHQMYPLMAAYSIKARREWHLEQFSVVHGVWLHADAKYWHIVDGDFDRAVWMAKRNPKMFQVVFRDDYTGKERKVEARRKVLRASETLLPHSGPYIVRPIEPVKPRPKSRGLTSKPPTAASVLGAMASAFAAVNIVAPILADTTTVKSGTYVPQTCYIAP